MSVNVSYKNTVHPYGVSPAMLVQNLKEEISNKQNLYQFKLFLDQVELIDQRPVIKYLFTNFTLCFDDKEAAVEINDFTLGVAVVRPDDPKVITESVTPEMTVGQFKQVMSRKLNSTQGKLILKKDGKEVSDKDLVKTLLVVKTFIVKIEEIKVGFKFNEKLFYIMTSSDMTVLEFKTICSKKIPLSVKQICLSYNGNYLDPFEKLDSETRKPTDEFISKERMMEMEKVYENRTMGSYQILPDSQFLITNKLPGGF